MSFKNIIISVLVLIVSACGVNSNAASEKDNLPSLSFDKLIKLEAESGDYNIEGVVVYRNECLSGCQSSIPDLKRPLLTICPQMCLEGVIISLPDNEEKRLIIFTHGDDYLFQKGEKYRFSVKLTAHDSSNNPVYRLESLGYKQIK